MVIQCSSCDTRFKIADDKVKAGGVKVRCSKCKEVFTVLPPEETQAASPEIPEPSADLNSSDASQMSSEESSSGLDDVDWSSLNSESSEEYTDESDEPTDGISSSDFSFSDDEDTETTEDEFSFDDEETSSATVVDEETFSFGGDATSDDDSVGFDEPVGEGAQDEFSFAVIWQYYS